MFHSENVRNPFPAPAFCLARARDVCGRRVARCQLAVLNRFAEVHRAAFEEGALAVAETPADCARNSQKESILMCETEEAQKPQIFRSCKINSFISLQLLSFIIAVLEKKVMFLKFYSAAFNNIKTVFAFVKLQITFWKTQRPVQPARNCPDRIYFSKLGNFLSKRVLCLFCLSEEKKTANLLATVTAGLTPPG